MTSSRSRNQRRQRKERRHHIQEDSDYDESETILNASEPFKPSLNGLDMLIISFLRSGVRPSPSDEERLRCYAESLESQRSLRRADLEHYRALSAPIRRLPPEIISLIFNCVVTTNSFSSRSYRSEASHLGDVCYHWRTVSLAMPEIWSRVDLVFHDFTLSDHYAMLDHHTDIDLYDGNWLRDDDLLSFRPVVFERLREHVQRSADVHLTVHVDIHYADSRPVRRLLDDIVQESVPNEGQRLTSSREARNHPLKEVVFKQAHRIQNLRFTLRQDRYNITPFLHRLSKELVVLNRLSFVIKFDHEILVEFQGIVDSGLSTGFKFGGTDTTEPEHIPRSLILRQPLTRLRFPTSPNLAVLLLESLPSLEEAHFIFKKPGSSGSKSKSHISPQLRSLAFEFTSGFDDPYLEVISTLQDALTLPNLTELQYLSRHHPWMFPGEESDSSRKNFLESLPNLLVRSSARNIESGRDISELDRSVLLVQSTLRKFHVELVSLGGTDLISLLQDTPSVTELFVGEPWRPSRSKDHEWDPSMTITRELFDGLVFSSVLPNLGYLGLSIDSEIKSAVRRFAWVLEERSGTLKEACLELRVRGRVETLPVRRLREIQNKVALRVVQLESQQYSRQQAMDTDERKLLLGYNRA
uniref:Uncharacterized protein n=1 Tax=Moniliophthora roreri TaxID=221103 RepID=A0A0W0FQ84_MONRR